ncbi:mechanosensitive ion channel family protein [Haloarcula salinisoli]|uniref:Mechanosensitive ion channel family protein n=1 Tax=Haloarcula salinisoli TaxID=2487746 RepID=A0A8J8CDZ8_9EURY|nr:mechanosensitive ion channel family protein [Halomicroarcula salinisoli]MBX0287294.1 mechanosensitive ion channel family protein [Halomicroarcula salinisoli]MBX0305140.1 mechanosensitive ion channel family protein [Halomicroarcula salinisoli]
MQLPVPSVDLASVYAQLAQDGATFLVVAATVYLVGRLLVVPAVRWGLSRSGIDRTVQSALGSATHLLVIGVTLVAAAQAAGFRGALAGSTLVAAGLTVAVGLAAQDVLGNFVSGAFIVTDPDLNVGDTIEWDGKRGVIVDIDLRVTRVRTPNNERIVVPNTELATGTVTNRTSTGPIGISYEFGIPYDTDVSALETIVRDVARELDHVLEKPEPIVGVSELGSTAVLVVGRVWIPNERRNRLPAVRSTFVRRVNEECRTAGIDLSETTQHDVTGDLAVHDPAPEVSD